MSFSASTKTLTALFMGMFLLTGCSETKEEITEIFMDPFEPDVMEPTEAAAAAIGQRMCADAIRYVDTHGAPSDCDAALVADCTNIVGLLSDTYVVSIASCLDEGDSPMGCVLDATFDLYPTKAHHELASAYCEECLFGLDACEDAFFSAENGQLGLGTITLPFNDDVVRQVADECTEELTCAVDLFACAQEVLLKRLIPENTLMCLLNPLN